MEDAFTADTSSHYFGAADYVMLFLVLVISFLFGLYSAIFKKNSTIEEYVLGNRKLKTVPVSMSMVASAVSGLTIIGLPSETYYHGIGYIYALASMVIIYVIFYYGYLSVFYKLKITTLYQISWMSIALCLSSITLTQVSGINFYVIVVVSGVLTIFYTSVGGIKTVVWTDVVQTVFMIGGVVILAVKGTIDVGGLTVLWERNRMYGRLDPPRFALDFFERYSFWEMMVGHTIYFLVMHALNQGNVQRCVSVPTLRDARNCLILCWLGMSVFFGLSIYNGLVLFATFYDCDPLTSKKIRVRDQLIPLFTMKVLRNFSGLPGLFVAAISSATLSTLSTVLNSLAAVILHDFYKPFFSANYSEHCGHIIMKLTVVIFGLVSTGFVFVVVKLGSVIQVVNSLAGASTGPVLAIFTIGIFIPFVKSKAVIIASVISFLISCWISIGALLSTWSGAYVVETKPILTHGCDFNVTIQNSTAIDRDVLFIYKISHLWYAAIGFTITLILATILSAFMERNNVNTMDRDLLSPAVRFFIRENRNLSPVVNMPLLNHTPGVSTINE